jgi:hypothetical protein
MKINKNQRQNKVKEIISRWGRLNKAAIDTHISASFHLDLTEALKRAIYRDLDELVTIGELDILYFTRDGAVIDDFEPNVHKNYYNEWVSKNFNKAIFGQSLLTATNSDIFVSDLIKNDIKIQEKNNVINDDYRYLFFYLNSKYLNISFRKDAVPINIIISRFVDKITENEINEIEKIIGKRFVILKLASSSISSFKSSESIGHLVLDFKKNDLISVKDLNSKNGSVFYKITPDEADEIRIKGRALIEETVSVSWHSIPNEAYAKQKITNPIESYSPFIVEMGSSFRLLVI